VEGSVVTRAATFVTRVWNDFFFTGFSLESLALLRICFGSGLLVFHLTQFPFVFQINPFGRAYRLLEPMWHFELLGIEWHYPLLSCAAFLILILATVGVITGYRTRLSIAIVLIGIFYLKGVRDSFTGDVHHRYLVPTHMLFLLLLSRCGDARSFDARRRGTPRVVEEWEASWPIKAMQLYTVSFYFWAAIAKMPRSDQGREGEVDYCRARCRRMRSSVNAPAQVSMSADGSGTVMPTLLPFPLPVHTLPKLFCHTL
jgi:hypothetical protein